MFVAVIRGDIQKAIFIADVEPKSQANPPTESPIGQSRYLSRPDSAAITAYLTAQGLTGTAAALIEATVPVGGVGGAGTIDLTEATIEGVTGAVDATQLTAIRALLAVKLVETTVVRDSFLSGNLAGFRSASFNPDSRRVPPLANGAAIAVTTDDGITPFTVGLPTITTADLDTPTSGALRISGTGLTQPGLSEPTVILQGTCGVKLPAAKIIAAGGSITSTQINIPATLIVGVQTGYTTVRVRVSDLISNSVQLT